MDRERFENNQNVQVWPAPLVYQNLSPSFKGKFNHCFWLSLRADIEHTEITTNERQ